MVKKREFANIPPIAKRFLKGNNMDPLRCVRFNGGGEVKDFGSFVDWYSTLPNLGMIPLPNFIDRDGREYDLEGLFWSDQQAYFEVFDLIDGVVVDFKRQRGDFSHYFIESEQLAKFCIDSVKVITKDLCLAFSGLGDGGVIHTENGAVLYGTLPCRGYSQLLLITEKGRTWIPLTDIDELNKGTIPDEARLVLGAYLYRESFPESVVDGIPCFLKYPRKITGGKKVAIRGVTEIIDRAGSTPHFRKGHFRFLSSDRFTNKQGQVVFVKGAFVRGRAKTILDQREAQA